MTEMVVHGLYAKDVLCRGTLKKISNSYTRRAEFMPHGRSEEEAAASIRKLSLVERPSTKVGAKVSAAWTRNEGFIFRNSASIRATR